MRVEARDRMGRTAEKALTVTVLPVTGTGVVLSPSSNAENAPVGSVVGALSSTPQVRGATYTLVGGAGSADNADFEVRAATLVLRGSADFEAKATYSVRCAPPTTAARSWSPRSP